MEAPRIVGRYAVHGEIATGGMATVHLGRLLGPVGFARTVALKRLHPQFASDPEFVAMFLDEARIAARIRHPNVAATLDVVAEGSELLLVMEYVEGESLARLLRLSRQRGQSIPLSVASAIGVALLTGLDAAHRATSEQGEPLGVVHRDVSPQNVLVGVDGGTRVVDFGIAKAVGRSQVTREGQLKGKLPYMAPEQIRRDGVVGARTDVYGAAVVLWETVTGRRLFEGEDVHVLSAVLANDVPPVRALRRDAPSALEAVVMRGLSGDAGARFASAAEMAAAVEAAVPPATASEVSAWVRGLAADTLERRAAVAAGLERATPAVVATPLATVRPPASSEPASPPGPAPRRGWVWPLSAALVVVAVAVGWAVGRRSESLPASAPIVVSVAAPVSSATSASASAPAAPSSAPSANAVPAATSGPKAPPRPTTAPSAAPTKADPCNPPYRWENGIKKFKPECL